MSQNRRVSLTILSDGESQLVMTTQSANHTGTVAITMGDKRMFSIARVDNICEVTEASLRLILNEILTKITDDDSMVDFIEAMNDKEAQRKWGAFLRQIAQKFENNELGLESE